MPNSCTSSLDLFRRPLVLLSIVVFLPLICDGNQASGSAAFSTSPISIAKTFLHHLYPELSLKGYTGKIELSAPFGRDWTSIPLFSLEISTSSIVQKKPVTRASGQRTVFGEETVLSALFGFDSNGIIQDLHLHSPEVVFDAMEDKLR